jgi:hypothetical protein
LLTHACAFPRCERELAAADAEAVGLCDLVEAGVDSRDRGRVAVEGPEEVRVGPDRKRVRAARDRDAVPNLRRARVKADDGSVGAAHRPYVAAHGRETIDSHPHRQRPDDPTRGRIDPDQPSSAGEPDGVVFCRDPLDAGESRVLETIPALLVS